jgi:hypothetical protein
MAIGDGYARDHFAQVYRRALNDERCTVSEGTREVFSRSSIGFAVPAWIFVGEGAHAGEVIITDPFEADDSSSLLLFRQRIRFDRVTVLLRAASVRGELHDSVELAELVEARRSTTPVQDGAAYLVFAGELSSGVIPAVGVACPVSSVAELRAYLQGGR